MAPTNTAMPTVQATIATSVHQADRTETSFTRSLRSPWGWRDAPEEGHAGTAPARYSTLPPVDLVIRG